MAKKTNIIEPIGGIDGMNIQAAMAYAQKGCKVRRVAWPKGTSVYLTKGTNWPWVTDGVAYKPYSADVSDFVSCDWIVESEGAK